MLNKPIGIAALEVTDRPAACALFVKMRVAVARPANVLIDAPASVVALKFTNRLVAAKVAKMSVDTAPALLGIAVDGNAKLLCRELTVGIAREIVDQSLPPGRFVSFLLHKKACFLQFENHSQIIAQTVVFVKFFWKNKKRAE